MSKVRVRLRICACMVAGFVASAMTGPPAHAATTYYIDESTDFTGNGCQNADLNDVTSDVKEWLDEFGWGGFRYTNASAWPQDFMESCSSTFGSGGLDSTYADARLLSVYAGHGNVGLLQWGFPRLGICTLDFSSNMRIGSMAGTQSAYAMYVTSCTLKIESLPNEANFQWERQQFGFDNSPSVGDGDPGAYAICTFNAGSPQSNKFCWLNALEDKPGWFTGDNSPVVVSYGTSSSDCQNTANSASLFGNALNSPTLNTPRSGGPACNQGQPSFWYCYNWIDHGGC